MSFWDYFLSHSLFSYGLLFPYLWIQFAYHCNFMDVWREKHVHLDGGAWVESAVFFAGNVVHAIFSQLSASKLSLSANLQGPRGIRFHVKR